MKRDATQCMSTLSFFCISCCQMNYYDLLDVPKDASRSDIRKNFLALSKALHTDRNPRTGHIFSAVNDAYNVLSNDNERRMYDQKLQQRDLGQTYIPFKKHTHSVIPRRSFFDTTAQWDDFPSLDLFDRSHWDDKLLAAASKDGEVSVSHYSNMNGNKKKEKRQYRHGSRIS